MRCAKSWADSQEKLDSELARLKAKLGLAGHLRVVWGPDRSSEKEHGVVKGSTIFLYDMDENEALRTMRHEFVEYVLTNELLTPRLFEANAHGRADALVDIIASLI